MRFVGEDVTPLATAGLLSGGATAEGIGGRGYRDIDESLLPMCIGWWGTEAWEGRGRRTAGSNGDSVECHFGCDRSGRWHAQRRFRQTPPRSVFGGGVGRDARHIVMISHKRVAAIALLFLAMLSKNRFIAGFFGGRSHSVEKRRRR